jgi:hypothetical protein
MPRRNTVTQLRLNVFILWIVFATILSVLPCGILLRPRFADSNMVFELMKLLAGLWLPALACFSAFWFSEGNERGAQDVSPTESQKIGSYALTFLYFAICILIISLTFFAQKYEYDAMGDLIGPSIDKQTASVVSWLQLLSPVLLAPIGFLTGKVPNYQSHS